MRPLTPSDSKKPVIMLALAGVALLVVAIWASAGAVSVLLGAVGVALIIGAVVISAYRESATYKKQQEAFARAREIIAAHVRAGRQASTSGRISGEQAGVRFEHYFMPGDGKKLLARTAVAVATSAPGEFHIHPESGATEFAKLLGMVDEFRSGDNKLDLDYFFSGTTDEYVRAVFGVRENMEVVRALLALGFDQIEKTGDRLRASAARDTYLGVEEVNTVVGHLTRLRLPPVVAGAEGRQLLGRKALHYVRGTQIAVITLGVVGFVSAKPLLEGWLAFALGTMGIVAVVGIAALAAAYLALKGRSMSMRGIAELLTMMPLFVMALFPMLSLANQHLDTHAAREHQVKLIKHWYTSGSRGGSSYHLAFESWRGRGGEEINNVGVDVYNLARPGQLWKVRVRPGWLNQPWIEALAPVR